MEEVLKIEKRMLAKYIFDIHWYSHNGDNTQLEMKMKFRKEK